VRAVAAEQMSSSLVALTVTEGKYHQIKRMVAAVSTARERDEYGAGQGEGGSERRCVCYYAYVNSCTLYMLLSHMCYATTCTGW
jgi:hypothetical protein